MYYEMLGTALRDLIIEGLFKLRRSLSRFFPLLLWIMTLRVDVVQMGLGDHRRLQTFIIFFLAPLQFHQLERERNYKQNKKSCSLKKEINIISGHFMIILYHSSK